MPGKAGLPISGPSSPIRLTGTTCCDKGKDLGQVFILAIVLDVIYQVIVVRWLYRVETLIVAAVLAIFPYLLIHGPVTRLARGRHQGVTGSKGL